MPARAVKLLKPVTVKRDGDKCGMDCGRDKGGGFDEYPAGVARCWTWRTANDSARTLHRHPDGEHWRCCKQCLDAKEDE